MMRSGLLARLNRARGALQVAEAVVEEADREEGLALALYGSGRGAHASVHHLLASRSEPGPEIPSALHRDRGVLARALAQSQPLVTGEALLVPLRSAERLEGALLAWGWAEEASSLQRWSEPIRDALHRAHRADADARDAAILSTLLPLLSQGALAVTTDGEVLHYSRVLQRLVGWTEEEVREHGWTNLVYSNPVDRAAAQRAIGALVLGEPSRGILRQLSHKRGNQLEVAISSAMVPDPAGGAPTLIGLMTDQTTQREVRRARSRDENLARLGRLAGTVAHDMNNLLCAVMGHAELIESVRDQPERVDAHADIIVDAAERGAQLTRELLAFAGADNTRTRPTWPADTCRRVRDLLAPRTPDGVEIRLEVAPDVPAAEVDPDQLHQALMSLVTNALEAVGSRGEIAISIDTAPAPRRPTHRPTGAPRPGQAAVRVQVQDDGPGFPLDILERPFEPFVTTKVGGHGLGLAAIRGIATANDMAVDLCNRSGAVVALYLQPSRRPELAFDALAEKTPATGQRVWLLDDQRSVLEFSRVSLSGLGFEVEAFERVEDLLDAARRAPAHQRPQALVLDRVMPDGGGAAALAGLRQLGLSAPVLWVSGHLPEGSGLDPSEAFLPKPYTGRDLVAALQRLLSA